MRYLNHWIAILIIAVFLFALSGLALSGGHPARAFPASARVSPPAGSLAARASGAGSSEQTPSRSAKRPARDSEFSVYRNPEYGVSFRYPRNYALVEGGDSDDATVADYQQKLQVAQPGAVLVAAVVVPEDAHPNTSFQGGTMQFVVHPDVTAEACRSFVSAGTDDGGTAGSIAIPVAISGLSQGAVRDMQFDWRLRRDSANGASVENVDYAGFASGTCYEFLLDVVTSNDVEPDLSVKPAEFSKILRPLEKIVLSFQLTPKSNDVTK